MGLEKVLLNVYLARTIKNEMQTNRLFCRALSSNQLTILPPMSTNGGPFPSHYVPCAPTHARTHARTHASTHART